MQSRINWLGLCNDWAASGLSKQRYFLSTRFERFVRYGTIPSYSSVMHHLTDYEKSKASVAKSLPATSDAAIVHHLSSRDVKAALASVDDYDAGVAVNNHITMVLANGTTIEFEAENAERFALQAISLGRME